MEQKIGVLLQLPQLAITVNARDRAGRLSVALTPRIAGPTGFGLVPGIVR